MIDDANLVTVSGNLDASNAKPLEVDPEGMGHIMHILSNMYGDGPLAVLREYSCNARDSHVEAGQDLPIEVTLPSDLSPSLLIQDYGIGLSREGITNVFGMYGKSTKRATNGQVGHFGIGAKSAFTLGQQFIVTGVKDGRKTVVLFALNESNIPTHNVLSEMDTNEPNGVLISLAVDLPDVMWETARRFFSTWKPGTVLVNGQQPETVYADGRQITDNIWVREDGQGVKVVMGGVAYPVSREILAKVADRLTGEAQDLANRLRGWSSTLSIYMDVEIGSVQLMPSREGLRDTEKTLTTVAGALETLSGAVLESYTNLIEGVDTYWGAADTLNRSKDELAAWGLSEVVFTWNGLHLGRVQVELTNFILGSGRGRTKRVETHDEFRIEAPQHASKILAVTGVENPGSVRRISKRYLEQSGKERIVITDADAVSFEWFTIGAGAPVETMTLDEFKVHCKTMAPVYVREANEPSYAVGTRKPDQWTARTPLSEIVARDQEIVFFTEAPRKSALLDEVLEDRVAIVLMPTQKKEALLKRIPDAIDGAVEVKMLAEKVLANLNDDDLLLMAASDFQSDHGSTFMSLRDLFGVDLDGVTNKAIRAFDALYVEALGMTQDDDNRARVREIEGAQEIALQAVEFERFDGIDLEAFPLLSLYTNHSWRYSHRPVDKAVITEHLKTYLNGLA